MSALFSPLRLAGQELPNRIVISPMCQYSAEEGRATDWHMMHLGMLATSGAGLVMLEATAVEPEGRISAADLGLYDDGTEAALARVVAACHRYGSARLGIQIAHAGRKAGVAAPWQGGGPLGPEQPWRRVGPSALSFAEGWPVPEALSDGEMRHLAQAFADTAARAARIGLDVAEIHAAHGYLLHQFLSPIANRRTDDHGGPLENRMRFPLRVTEAVRAAWPKDRPLGVRLTGSDWLEGGITVEEAAIFGEALRQRGVDFLDVTSGGIARASIPVGPGYQVPFAAALRQRVEIPVMAVGLIVAPEQAERIVADGQADLVALGRTALDDPRWAWHAARTLGATVAYAPQYERAAPQVWPGHTYRFGTDAMN
ncbi:NADH:flavin oxidoreductase/NADH oxidase [Oleisolibacter albus]|uniref:NADH:flavin oxidoreductase/NADH oxidase n=1 Tax=Oleisolibacter albus TaxID=2171757 RepID=UPI000DF45364|nr:NADH:flavin oxidoreductase/NADH oxidase [Oleisolibacter albus]